MSKPVLFLANVSLFVLICAALLQVACPLASCAQPTYTLDSFKVSIDIPFNETYSTFNIQKNGNGYSATCFYDSGWAPGLEARNGIRSDIYIRSPTVDYSVVARGFEEDRTQVQTYVDYIRKDSNIVGSTPMDTLVSFDDTPNRTSYVFKRTLDTSRPTNMASGYGGMVVLLHANGNAEINWFVADYDLASVQAMIQTIEDRCYELWEGKSSLTLTYYSPFSPEILSYPVKSSGTSAVFSPHYGGDVVVTLKDAEGNPIISKDVYFTMVGNPGHNDAIVMPESDDVLSKALSPLIPHADPVISQSWGRYQKATTDAFGNATFNFIREGYVNYDNLEKPIRDMGGIVYWVYADVFDKDPEAAVRAGSSVKIISSGSTPIEIKSVAVVENIYYKRIPGLFSMYGIYVMPPDGHPLEEEPITEEPYGILPRDIILMKKNTLGLVTWLSGERLYISPKESYFLDPRVKYAAFQIGSMDMGIYQRIKQSNTRLNVKALFEGIHLGHSGIKAYYTSSYAPIGHAIVITLGVMAGEHVITYIGDSSVPVDIGRDLPKNYLIIRPHSSFLIDMDYNNSTIYTIEGTVEAFKSDGTSVNVTTGNKMTVAPDGTFGPILGFSQNEVEADQKQLLDNVKALEAADASPAATNPPASASPKSPAPGLLATILGVLLVGYLLRQRSGF